MHMTGTGSLWLDGEEILPSTKYVVVVTQRGIMQRATGRIEIEQHVAGKLIAKLGPNSDLVLVLEDGRRWPCTLANSNGDLMGRGEIR